MIPVDDAFAHYRAWSRPVPSEVVPLSEATGRVLAETVRSLVDLPIFTQSAMDGYAVRAADCVSDERHVRLRLDGVIAAGRLTALPPLPPGCARRIYTGGAIPPGADAVVRQEDVRAEGDDVWVPSGVPQGLDVRPQGEALRQGDAILADSATLYPGTLGALAMSGVGAVSARRKVRICVLTTGDEIADPGTALQPGEVYDANRAMLLAALAPDPSYAVTHAHLRDDLDDTVQAIAAAAEAADLIVTTGGVSVGDRDHVPDAARRAGFTRQFWKVAQQPGKPVLFATTAQTALLGLPGNPAAVFCLLHTHLAHLLDLLRGASPPRPHSLPGALTAPVPRLGDRTRWVRARRVALPGGLLGLEPLPAQGSHMLGNLADCDALARVEPGDGAAPAGTITPWSPVRPI